MSSSVPRVLIVGAGPSGLVAALTLLQNGIPVRIIEKELIYRVGQRGTTITPRSLELYHFLGVTEILDQASFLYTVRKYVGGSEAAKTIQMMPWIDPTPSCPWLAPRAMGQDHVISILCSHLEMFSCRVELGTKLQSFEQRPDHVAVNLVTTQDSQDSSTREIIETAYFDWVVGADGARGIVRKALGLTFVGETREERLTIGDIHVDGLATDSWHMWGDTEAEIMVLKPTENKESNVFQFFVHGQEVDHVKLTSDHTELVKYFVKLSGIPTEAFGEIICASEYRPNIRMVDKFGEGRVFVVGDAAHVHSPAGGQGLNSSIQDAFNLAWKLALVCKSLSPSTLLSSYSHERLPVIAQMLSITTEIHKKSLHSESAWQRGRNLLQLDINYRGSNIIVDETKGGGNDVGIDSYNVDGFLRGGDRAPDAPALAHLKSADGSATRLFDIFKPWYHTALVFVSSDDIEQSQPILQALQSYPAGMVRSVIIHPQGTGLSAMLPSDALTDFLLEDREGHAYKFYGVSHYAQAVIVYIIRPDGVVGGIVYTAVGVRRYFCKIYS